MPEPAPCRPPSRAPSVATRMGGPGQATAPQGEGEVRQAGQALQPRQGRGRGVPRRPPVMTLLQPRGGGGHPSAYAMSEQAGGGGWQIQAFPCVIIAVCIYCCGAEIAKWSVPGS